MEVFAQHARESGATVLDSRGLGCAPASWPKVSDSYGSAEFQAFTDQLAALAEKSPLVVCLDDPHGREELKWRWLLEATRRRLRKCRVMLVVSLLPLGGPRGLDFQCDLLRQPNLHRIRLHPLDRDRTGELLDTFGGVAEDEALRESLYAASGGNPLLVRALVEEIRPHTGIRCAASWLRPGGLFARAALDCVLGSGPYAALAAVGMAALREFSDSASLAAVLRLDAAEVARGESLLQAAGLTQAGRLRHPVIEAAVLEYLGSGERATVLLGAAEVLRERGTDARTIAGYLLQVGSAVAPWHIATLQRAADEALEQDDTHFADTCLRVAREGATDCWERARLTVKCFQVMLRTDPWRAEQWYVHNLAPADCEHGVDACPASAELRARLLIRHGRLGEAALIVEAVSGPVAEAPLGAPRPDSVCEAWMRLMPFVPNTPDALAAWPSPAVVGDGGSTGTTSWSDPPAEELPERARHVHETEEQLRTSVLGDTTLALILPELTNLVTAGRPDRAALWSEHFMREADKRGAEGWRQLFMAVRADAALAMGRLTDAESYAAEVVDLAGEAPSCWLYGGPLAVLITVRTATGRYEEAARLLDRPVPEGFFTSVYSIPYVRARGRFLLAVNRPRLALSDFLTVGQRAERWHLHDSLRPSWRIDAAEAWLRLGNEHEAGQLLAQHAPVDGRWLRVKAQLADASERPSLLTRAAEDLQATGSAWELARVLTELAEAYRALDQPARADLALRKAQQLADECGAGGPLIDRIAFLCLGGSHPQRPSHGPAVVPDPAASLSESERKVAVLAAQGLTNREISAELYITVSTVEQHLTRVYKKLDITSRQELPLHIKPELRETA
ncbi:LuxR C-terminal-related transcriptional regulator [Streptomyces sp. CA-210063]|uniref:LuxR family transcriptional regulator n=1 Tax=Streptomyces sp. CA-210063 TaxID=2801029 RepID=UPI00214CB87B|nr:LuxR family transcriptional regulator [Streptomyces sp. CA-210063]UUU36191.1 LuxR C-terminal-related transcriptional regulator [Streptomyces sp. CA-210063]